MPDTLFACVVPYRLRWLHQAWAWLAGYFWLPCPLCGRPFGGHEWRRDAEGFAASIPAGATGLSDGICPRCTREGKSRNPGREEILRQAWEVNAADPGERMNP